jgi:hypothetical protein
MLPPDRLDSPAPDDPDPPLFQWPPCSDHTLIPVEASLQNSMPEYFDQKFKPIHEIGRF